MEELVARLSPVSLSDLDARAALQKRVDNKYLVAHDDLEALVDALAADHEVLEIDGRRVFGYESAYFDTPDLRFFRDHVEGRAPRHKVRSRRYRDSGLCQFEVKTKRADGEMAKASMEADAACHGRIDDETHRFIAETTDDIDPHELRLTLVTRFRRCTLGARDGGERVTVDGRLTLLVPDDGCRRMRDDRYVVETKTAGGDGRADRVLRDAGHATVSLSKYRMGVGLLLAEDPDPPLAEVRHDLFRPCKGAADGAAAPS